MATGTVEGHRGVAIFIVLIAISSLSPLGINIVVPSLPHIGRQFGIEYGVAQLALSLFLASSAIFLFVTGPLADIFGRRPVLFAGLGVFFAATIAAALAPNIWALLIARVIQAAGASAGVVIGRAAIGDLYERDRAASVMAYVTMGYGLAPLLAPAIGGAIEELYGWRANFVFLTAIGVLVTVAAWFVLPETAHARAADGARPSFGGAVGELGRVPAFWAIALTNAFGSGVYFTLLGGGSYVSEHILGLSPAAYGIYFILVAAGYMVGNWFTGRHAVRIGSMQLVNLGSATILVSVVAIVIADAVGLLNPITLFAPTFFIGIANGLITPNCVALGIAVRPRLAGTASGIASALQLGFGGLASTTVGLWIAQDQRAFPLTAQMTIVALMTIATNVVAARLMRGIA